MEKIEISYKTIVFTVFLLIGLWLLYEIRQTLLLFFICIIFSTALSPIVDKLEKFHLPRPVAIFLLYFLLIGIFVGTVASLIPMLINQTSALLNDLPKFLDRYNLLNFDFQLSDYTSELAKLPANVIRIASSAFSNLVRILAFLVINFYLLMERKNLKKYLHFLFAENGEVKAESLIVELENKLGGWVRGELLLMLVIGIMSYIGLLLLDVDFAFPLALLAGFLELIPNVGPTLSMIPAAIIGFGMSPVIGLAVVALYFLVQQLENNLIVPKVMQQTVGLHPLITLAVLMIGFRLGGIGGTLLAVPTLIFCRVIFEQFYHSSRVALPQNKKA